MIAKKGFPGSSAGKESACNAGDPGSIPGLGKSLGEGIGYPLQHSWASLVAQTVKNPPEIRETWVQSLGWEDPLEEGMAIHSSTLAWGIPRTEVLAGTMGSAPWQSMGSQTIRHDWVTNHSTAIAKKAHVGNTKQVRFVFSARLDVQKRVKDDKVKRDPKTQEAGLL